MNILKLPEAISTPHGLRDKIIDLYRDTLSLRDKIQYKLYYKIEAGTAIFYNRATGEVMATYKQFGNDKYKIV